jgi:hypothetical protein
MDGIVETFEAVFPSHDVLYQRWTDGITLIFPL